VRPTASHQRLLRQELQQLDLRRSESNPAHVATPSPARLLRYTWRHQFVRRAGLLLLPLTTWTLATRTGWRWMNRPPTDISRYERNSERFDRPVGSFRITHRRGTAWRTATLIGMKPPTAILQQGATMRVFVHMIVMALVVALLWCAAVASGL
jgi:hypothetical protein